MSPAFRRHRRAVRMELHPGEAELLRLLRDDLRVLLSDPDPDDPVTLRLFPAAVTDDEDADAELRRLVYDDLLRARLDGLDALVEILDRATVSRSRLRVDLVDDEPTLVLGVLNDLRLALGARVGIEGLDRDDVPPEAAQLLAIMDHLAGLQEQLLAVLDPEAVRHYDEGHDLP